MGIGIHAGGNGYSLGKRKPAAHKGYTGGLSALLDHDRTTADRGVAVYYRVIDGGVLAYTHVFMHNAVPYHRAAFDYDAAGKDRIITVPYISHPSVIRELPMTASLPTKCGGSA